MSISLEATEPVAPDEDSPTPDPEETTPEADPTGSRRHLFKLGAAALVAAVATPRRAAAQRIIRPHTARPKAPPASGDSLLRLVRRVTNGVTEEEFARAKSMGFSRYLDYQLRPQSINDSAVESFVSTTYPMLALDGLGLSGQDPNTLYNQFVEATAYRAAFSKRQLYERMVHFWSDHFTIYYPKVNYLKILDDRQVIRAHALGKFPDMLRASAHSAAMLLYLDNTLSSRNNVNQNYAREIMELHSLGVDGGYTQMDVEEVTRCLTGWTIQGRGDFRFDPNRHDFTQKVVLGTTIPAMPPTAGAQGVQDGETVLNLLLAHPSTAKFVSFKMIRWLLRYDPPQALVDKVAATYTRTGGDIPSMIKDILTPANLTAAPAKYRQPYQLMLAALRATQPTVTSMAALVGLQLRTLGQQLFQWEDPDGYPDNVDWWAGTILQRWNFCSTLSNLATGATVVDVNPLMTVATADGVAEALNKRAFAGSMPADLKLDLTTFLAAGPINAARVREAFALALSSNAFQWF